MGVIDSKPFIERIKNRTEKETGEKILEEAKRYNKTIIDGNYQTLLEYFKGDEFSPSFYASLICFLDYNSSRALFDKILNFFKMYNIDKDHEFEVLIDHAKDKLIRSSEWKHENLRFINLPENKFKSLYASFKYENKWNHGTAQCLRRIILDENNTVVWIKNDYIEPNYYICTENRMYGLYYNHTQHMKQCLIIYDNNEVIDLHVNIRNINDTALDAAMEELDAKIINYNTKEINLSGYFEKRFFYKGPKWVCEFPPKEITVITNVQKENGYIRIEIENVTYPHSGYLILDIENAQIVEAKKY